MISVSGLSKSFKIHKKSPGLKGSIKSLFAREWTEIHALKSVSLEVKPGEILGLLGANGAGKTTLVKILSGIIHPSSGEASVLGHKPWERSDEFRRSISLIMGQKAQLWWDLPAADNFDLLREIYQVDPIQHKRSLEHLVETLGVQNQLNVQVRRLSLGERMKMELIAALLHNPKVVFLDEPTIGLDLTAQRAVRSFIHSYREEFKPVMILTSHYMEDIENLCQRVAIIRGGQLIYDGSLKSIVNQFVQDRILSFVLETGATISDSVTWPGERLSSDTAVLKLKVKKAEMAKAISQVMSMIPVRDIHIEERDVADVIENMIRVGG